MSFNKNIRLKPLKSGFIVEWNYEVPGLQYSQSYQYDKEEIFKPEEEDKAIEKVVSLHKENIQKFREALAKQSTATKTSSDVGHSHGINPDKTATTTTDTTEGEDKPHVHAIVDGKVLPGGEDRHTHTLI